jgi:hypothetical protein
MPRHDALPPNLPPRGLCRAAAAQYIGISAAKFDELVRDGRVPKPIVVDSRRLWDRRGLDRFFDEHKGGDAEHNEWDSTA